MKKQKYEPLEIEIITFEVEDIIGASGGDEIELPLKSQS